VAEIIAQSSGAFYDLGRQTSKGHRFSRTGSLVPVFVGTTENRRGNLTSDTLGEAMGASLC
jgi:hypothetical protein